MLKIKDNVDLKELEKFGFKYIEDLFTKKPYFFKKTYLENADDDRICYHIEVNTRKIIISRLDGDLDDTLYDLIKADLVEKVDDND